ncbi:MAG: cell division protein FtsB [Gammaproteobacteria bacterium]
MRWLIALLVAILLVLQYRLWVGEGSLAEVWRLQQQVAAQRKENERLMERNMALDAEVTDLKQGMAAIEEHARNDLGMIKENEVFYQVIED